MRAVLIIIAAVAATASAAPDPRAIQKDIDKELVNLEGKLKSGAVDDARDIAGKLAGLYGTLKDDKGKADATKLQAALLAAEQLTQNDKLSPRLAEICAQRQQMLRETIESYEKQSDAAAIKLLPELAESARKEIEKDFNDVRKLRSAMDGWYRTAGSFSPALTVWRGIRGQLKDVSTRSYASFVVTFDRTEEACQRIAKGKNHPEVLAAVLQLKARHGERAADLAAIEDEIAEYATMIGGFRDWYRKDTDAVARAFCAAGEKWGTDDVDRAPIVAVLDRTKAELTTRAKKLEDEYQHLVKALDEAGDDPKVKEAKAAITKVHTSFTRAIAEEPLAQGANNPKIRMRMEAGKAAHSEIQNRCSEKEGVIDSSNRVDCIQKCTVVEIKPDTASGRSDGDAQKKRYKEAFEKLFKDRPKFDKQFPRLAKECVSGGKLDLDYDVALYKFCPSSYDDLGFGPALDARLTNPEVLNKIDLDGK